MRSLRKYQRAGLISIYILLAISALPACSFSMTAPGAELPPPVTLDAPDLVNGVNSIAGALSYEERQPPFLLYPGGPPVKLTNNPEARDPTLAEVIEFLLADQTDLSAYLPNSYMCSGFAQDLHDNAESAGYRAAWVAIDFADRSIGHAATGFQTIDHGLVIIDDTSAYDNGGRGLGIDSTGNFDKMAYVAIGKEYGIIALEVAESPLYNYYLDYLEKLDCLEGLKTSYEQEAIEYNQAAKNGSRSQGILKSWYEWLKTMESEIDELAAELGGYYWESLGIVSEVKIYW